MSCSCASALRYRLELVDIIKHNDEVVSFDFKQSEVKGWFEGDSSKLFVTLNGQEVGKKFSYATLPHEERIRFTTRIKLNRSEYKEQLSLLKVGDTLEITEPSGDFKLQRMNRPLVLLSNGVGIAASRSLIKAYEHDQNKIPAIIQINVDSTGDIYKSELDDMMKVHESFKSLYTSHRDDFYKQLDCQTQQLMAMHDVDPYFYVVGSNAFVNGNISHLKSVGFTDADIITDGHVASEGYVIVVRPKVVAVVRTSLQTYCHRVSL